MNPRRCKQFSDFKVGDGVIDSLTDKTSALRRPRSEAAMHEAEGAGGAGAVPPALRIRVVMLLCV